MLFTSDPVQGVWYQAREVSIKRKERGTHIALEQLVQDDPHRPPVCFIRVKFLKNDLRGHVDQRPCKAICNWPSLCSSLMPQRCTRPVKVLAQTKVANANMPVRLDEDIARLQVTMDDFIAVKEFDSDDLANASSVSRT